MKIFLITYIKMQACSAVC